MVAVNKKYVVPLSCVCGCERAYIQLVNKKYVVPLSDVFLS